MIHRPPEALQPRQGGLPAADIGLAENAQCRTELERDRGHRVAEFVGDGGEEFVPRLDPLPQLFDEPGPLVLGFRELPAKALQFLLETAAIGRHTFLPAVFP